MGKKGKENGTHNLFFNLNQPSSKYTIPSLGTLSDNLQHLLHAKQNQPCDPGSYQSILDDMYANPMKPDISVLVKILNMPFLLGSTSLNHELLQGDPRQNQKL